MNSPVLRNWTNSMECTKIIVQFDGKMKNG